MARVPGHARRTDLPDLLGHVGDDRGPGLSVRPRAFVHVDDVLSPSVAVQVALARYSFGFEVVVHGTGLLLGSPGSARDQGAPQGREPQHVFQDLPRIGADDLASGSGSELD